MTKKYLWLFILGSAIYTSGNSQNKSSLSVYAGSGVSYFRGTGSASQADYFRNGLSFPDAIDTVGNHFGRRPGGNFIAGIQVEYSIKNKWSVLLNTQYEHTGASLQSNKLTSPAGTFTIDGSYFIYYYSLSISPRLARNFQAGKAGLSLLAGVDYSIGLSLGDRFNFIDQNGKRFSISHSGGKPETNDFRLGAGCRFTLRKWGLEMNYHHGLSDFSKDNPEKATMRLFQAKLLYRVLEKPRFINPKLK